MIEIGNNVFQTSEIISSHITHKEDNKTSTVNKAPLKKTTRQIRKDSNNASQAIFIIKNE